MKKEQTEALEICALSAARTKTLLSDDTHNSQNEILINARSIHNNRSEIQPRISTTCDCNHKRWNGLQQLGRVHGAVLRIKCATVPVI